MGKPLPEPPGLPIIGHSMSLNTKNLRFICADYAEKCGKIFQLRVFGHTVVFINDDKVLRKAFAGDEYGDIFNDRPDNFAMQYVMRGMENRPGCMGRNDKAVGAVRKMSHKGLKYLGEGLSSFEQHINDELMRFITEIKSKGEEDIDICELLRTSFANMMSSLLTGKPAKADDSKIIWDWVDAFNAIMAPEMEIVLRSFPFMRNMPGKYGRVFKTALKCRDACLDRFILETDITVTDSLVSMIYDMQREENDKAGYQMIDDFYIMAFVQGLIFAAVDTTCGALINSFALLLRFPEIASRIQDEIVRIVGKSRAAEISDRAKMPYTRAFILELFRYTSHLPFTLPRRVSEDTVLEGYFIREYATIFANVWYIHHDPKLWTDPWNFRPERFLDSEGQLLSHEHELRQAVVTFSFGKRGCPGETLAVSRIFLYITRVLQEFDIRPPSSGVLPETDPHSYTPGITNRVKDYLIQARCIHQVQ